MNLPERARPLLDRLREYALRPAMAEFRRNALCRFAGEERDLDPEEEEDLLQFLIHDHRDGGGRTFIDHFIAAEEGTLSPQEREAIGRFRDSVLALFQVEEVRHGEGIRLRRAGGEERYDVVENTASRSLKAGGGIFARIIPYRDHHEIAGNLYTFPGEVFYLSERALRRSGEEARRQISDPSYMLRFMRGLSRQPQPAGNQLEAELQAAQFFSETRFPLSVEEAQRRFQTAISVLDIIRDLGDHAFRSHEEMQQVMEALITLWNHTPRQDLGGVTPAEERRRLEAQGRPPLHEALAQDLLRHVSREVDLESYPDDESRRQAIAGAQNRWMRTPQEELGGRAPEEMLNEPSPPPLPREEELPPPGRPAWPLEAVRERLGHPSDLVKVWAVRMLIRLTRAAPEETVGELLANPDDQTASAMLDVLDELLPGGLDDPRLIAAVLSEKIELLVGRGGKIRLKALEVLSRIDSGRCFGAFVECLSSKSLMDRLTAIELIGKSGNLRMPELLMEVLRSSDEIAEMAAAVNAIVGGGSAGAAAAALRIYIERSAGGEFPEEAEGLYELMFHLSGIGISDEFAFKVYQLFDPEPLHDATTQVDRLSFLMPSTDPAAARRCREFLTPDAATEIMKSIQRRRGLHLARRLAERVPEVIRRSAADNPAFARLGEKLEAFVRAVVGQNVNSQLSRTDQMGLAAVITAILAKALRGRDVAAELPAAGADAGRLLDLIRLDEPWLEEADLERLRDLLPGEALREIAAAPDRFASFNAQAILALQDPARQLDSLIDISSHWDRYRHLITHRVLGLAGDAALPIAAGRLHRDTVYVEELVFIERALATISTGRSAAYLELFFDSIDWKFTAGPVLIRLVMDLGSRRAAFQLIQRLRRGDIASLANPDEPARRETAARLLEALLALYEIPGDARALIEEGNEKFRERQAARGEEAADSDDWDGGDRDPDADDGEDDGEDWELGDSSESSDGPPPTATIRREEPKVGRNDPCPCGSGKKFKKCCGR